MAYNYGARKMKKSKKQCRNSKIMVSKKLILKNVTRSYISIKIIKILKFTDILKVQNCHFVYRVEQNNALVTSFLALHSIDKHNYQTRPATQNLLDVPLARTNKYGKESVKYECIRDWNNFKK